MEGELDDREVTYTINRLAALTAADADVIPPDNLMSRSLGAFLAGQRAEQEGYLEKVEELWQQTRRQSRTIPKLWLS